ncbi:FCD domain-containing protein, partial [Enterococcus faecium]
RASGVVATQQGVGAFVVQSAAAPAFRVDEASLGALNEVVAVLELRISVEAEAAALAAQRRTPEHLATMRDALERMTTSIAAGEDAIGPDLDF